MNTKRFNILASVAWAACAATSARHADAFAFTTQIGDYASCSANYQLFSQGWCWDVESGSYLFHTSYTQTIKFVSLGCNSGACQDKGTVYTDQVYGPGRKPANGGLACGLNYMYTLGDCAC